MEDLSRSGGVIEPHVPDIGSLGSHGRQGEAQGSVRRDIGEERHDLHGRVDSIIVDGKDSQIEYTDGAVRLRNAFGVAGYCRSPVNLRFEGGIAKA